MGGGREAIRQLAELTRRLATAEDALGDALAAMKRAETAFDAASDRFEPLVLGELRGLAEAAGPDYAETGFG